MLRRGLFSQFIAQQIRSSLPPLTSPFNRLLIPLYFVFLGHMILFSSSLIAEGISHQEIFQSNQESGQIYWKSNTSSDYLQATHLNSEAQVNISGLIASVIFKQSFKNQTNDWQEALYVMPLQEQAAVSFMQMQIGDRIVTGKIHEKKIAQQLYTQAKQQGKKAAITQQHRANLFTQKVANIAPGETIVVEIHYHHTVDYHRGQFEYVLPTTLTPRYSPSSSKSTFTSISTTTEADDLAQAQETHSERKYNELTQSFSNQVVNPLNLTLTLSPGFELTNISSRYHEIHIQKNDSQYHISTKEAWVPMDRDFVLTWQPTASAVPQTAFFQESLEQDTYGLLMVLPPNQQAVELPRDVQFIIDTSGSMSGSSIKQAKISLVTALQRLKTKDRFNITAFDSTTTSLFEQSIPVSDSTIQIATQWVNSLEASGGTEMLPALESVMQQRQDHHHSVSQIIFITDGSVSNEEEILRSIHTHIGQSTLFTVGIGSAPNRFFMRKASEFGRGTFTHIGDIHEIQTSMQTLFSKLEQAVLRELTMTWPIDVEMWPQKLPDLYANEPLIVAVKLKEPLEQLEQSELQIQGLTHGKNDPESLWQDQITLTPESADHPNISKLWARAKIQFYMDEKVRGMSEATVKKEILSIALPHQLVSAYTSFVAIEETPSRPLTEPLHKNAVANQLPHGSDPVAFPQTATAWQTYLLLSLLGLYLSACFKKNSLKSLFLTNR